MEARMGRDKRSAGSMAKPRQPGPGTPGDAQASTSHTRKRKREPRPPLLSNRHNGFALALRGVLHVLAHQVHAVHLLTVFLVLGGLQSPFDENL
jgi:hypothetical protein